MRSRGKHSKSMIRDKKIFILLIVLIIVSLAGVTMFSGGLKANIVDANAETIETENKNTTEATEEISKEVVLDNSGYLPLEKDINADDASIVLPETMHKWNFNRKDGKKIVYLTFDDGPSTEVTTQILDILDRNSVKATFFVLGSSIKSNHKAPKILKHMAKSGHAIANHGYSHKYKILYPNGVIDVKAFMNDMDMNLQLLRGILGRDFNTRVLRMPGGYGTWYGVTPLNEALKAKGYYQTDWNSLNGDAEGKPKNPQELLETLKKTMSDYDTLIVLMHDTDEKKNTVEYLQSAINYLKSQGFEFKTLK
ncbi:polysaccharide deacetylase [Clostridium gasigenes]|nr:polysaccharide deacetylase [Clostridium gasigenes]QSW21378.1 polysaccharide deacetylase [Clostridium gasigenes]